MQNFVQNLSQDANLSDRRQIRWDTDIQYPFKILNQSLRRHWSVLVACIGLISTIPPLKFQAQLTGNQFALEFRPLVGAIKARPPR